MKPTFKRMISRKALGATVLTAVLAWLPMTATAADQVKGGQKLTELNQIKTVGDIDALKAGDIVAMACAKCKSVWISTVDQQAKGGQVLDAQGKPTKLIAKHTCPGCKSIIEVAGHGKEKNQTVKHVCKACGDDSAFCCATKPGSGATAGMQKN
jgi:hypothetical protein